VLSRLSRFFGFAPKLTIAPHAARTSTIATGGTALTLFTGPINGGYITNPVNAEAQGLHTAENAYIDFVRLPGSSDATANGTTILLEPGQNFYLPALPTGVYVKGNAATSGHKLTVVIW
jgi:hypothetical protein